ncbi:GAF and ANTAR domain-containing protein [Streptomyces sp. NPDC005551]|uniref:GAF and ANTAR domain-containing protein n=1 Tax=unclassified Streptomyces TaxID=2593676 RepID=UPI0033DEAE9D
MNAGRTARITSLVAEQAAIRGARVAVVDVCTAAVAALPVGGAGVSAMSDTEACHPLCSTDEVSEQLEELQLTLGEGPCLDAFALGVCVLAPDLRAEEVRARWPVFAVSAVDAGAGAVFALPLQIGAISPGVLDLYAAAPVELDAEELADALAFADAATLVLLHSGAGEPGVPSGGGPSWDGRLEDLGAYRAAIDQASGMLTVQLGVGIEEAFVRLRAHAYANGRRLAEVASDVLAHRLHMTPDGQSYDTSPGAGPEPHREPEPEPRPGPHPGPEPRPGPHSEPGPRPAPGPEAGGPDGDD